MTGKYVLTSAIFFSYLEELQKNTIDGELKLAHALNGPMPEHILLTHMLARLSTTIPVLK